MYNVVGKKKRKRKKTSTIFEPPPFLLLFFADKNKIKFPHTIKQEAFFFSCRSDNKSVGDFFYLLFICFSRKKDPFPQLVTKLPIWENLAFTELCEFF